MVAEMRPLSELPEDIGTLRVAADAEGFDFIAKLVENWRSGANRFDRPGEILIEVRDGNRLVAVGGLNRDPYLDDPSVGRIRHVYIEPSSRGEGIGRRLVAELVGHARGTFDRVRLRAQPPGAPAFYDAIGFIATPDEPDSTHDIRF